MDVEKQAIGRLPFTEADLVGPADRPQSAWELTMYDWRVRTTAIIKDYLDEMDGTLIRAIQTYPKPEEGRIYVKACAPDAPKAHRVSLSPDHRQATFSLYTPLLAIDFPRLKDGYKAIFPCEPQQYGDVKVLAIDVKRYRIEEIESAEASSGTKSKSGGAGDSAGKSRVAAAEASQGEPAPSGGSAPAPEAGENRKDDEAVRSGGEDG